MIHRNSARPLGAIVLAGVLAVFVALPLAPARADDQAQTPATKPVHHRMDVEGYIKAQHDALHITQAEEQLWGAVAQIIRDNAKAESALYKERHAKSKSMNAIDDLHSYAAIFQARADAINKMIPAFEALYNAMSPDQKKLADAMFRHARGERAQKPSNG